MSAVAPNQELDEASARFTEVMSRADELRDYLKGAPYCDSGLSLEELDRELPELKLLEGEGAAEELNSELALLINNLNIRRRKLAKKNKKR